MNYGKEFVNLLECMSKIGDSVASELGSLRLDKEETKEAGDLESLVQNLASTLVCEHYGISREDLEDRFRGIKLTAGPSYAIVIVAPKLEKTKKIGEQYSVDLRGECEYVCPIKKLTVSVYTGRELNGTQKINFLKRISRTEKFWHRYRFRPSILLTKAQTKENGFSLRKVGDLKEFFQDFLRTSDRWGYKLNLQRTSRHSPTSSRSKEKESSWTLPSILDTEAYIEVPSKGKSTILLKSTIFSWCPSEIPEKEKKTLASLVNEVSKAFIEA